jgi:dihydroorotase
MGSMLIKNGWVVDPAGQVDGLGEVAILNQHIVAKTEKYDQCVDASGCYVLPGLIDFHTHLFTGSAFGVNQELFLPTGVTAAVDAGTTGCLNFRYFYQKTLSQSCLHLKAFLNVSGIGQPGGGLVEPLDDAALNWSRIEELWETYREVLLGIKIRISKSIIRSNGVKPLLDAMAFAKTRGIPVNVHVTDPVVPAAELLTYFQQGDIFCHVFHGSGSTILSAKGQVLPEAWAAKERGVIFDAANGRLNFCFKVAKQALSEGFYPDIISTDATANTFGAPGMVKNLPFVMSKYLNLGLSLKQVVRAVTETPAKLMGLAGKIGTLAPGADADVAICKLVKKPVVFKDALGEIRAGQEVLVPVMVILQGKVVYCQPDFN